MCWTWKENSYITGPPCQNNTQMCAAGKVSEESIHISHPKRGEVWPVTWLQFLGPWCSYIFRPGSKERPTHVWTEPGRYRWLSRESTARSGRSLAKSVHLGCCIPPISSAAKSRLFLRLPEPWFTYFSRRRWERRRIAQFWLCYGLGETLTILAPCQVLNVTFC